MTKQPPQVFASGILITSNTRDVNAPNPGLPSREDNTSEVATRGKIPRVAKVQILSQQSSAVLLRTFPNLHVRLALESLTAHGVDIKT